MFTNELPHPQVVHEADCPLREVDEVAMFAIQCYADDSTYTAVGNDPVELSNKLTQKYAVLADILT